MSKKKKETMIINGIDLLLNSANKMNRSMPEVYKGCGYYEDKQRKKKYKDKWKKEVKEYL